MRVSDEEKTKLDDIAGKLGLSTSDVVRLATKIFVPQFESGKIDLQKHLKNAA